MDDIEVRLAVADVFLLDIVWMDIYICEIVKGDRKQNIIVTCCAIHFEILF